MIAARWGILLMATLLSLYAFRASEPDLQASALRAATTAVVALLAPLFWPGSAATPTRTAWRVLAWSAAAAGAAVIALQLLGSPARHFTRVLSACAMLLPILLLTHAAVAALEAPLRRALGDAAKAREIAGGSATVMLALLGALPLWFGPAAELLQGRQPGAIDTALGLSPLTHLAVASGNDLLRNQWLYQQSNLAALPFAYPELATLAWCYALACLTLAVTAWALLRSGRPATAAPLAEPTPEKTP